MSGNVSDKDDLSMVTKDVNIILVVLLPDPSRFMMTPNTVPKFPLYSLQNLTKKKNQKLKIKRIECIQDDLPDVVVSGFAIKWYH